MAQWLHLFAEWLRCWAETIEPPLRTMQECLPR